MLRQYATSNGAPPTEEQGLQALVTIPTKGPVPQRWKKLMYDLPEDPWGRPYQYRAPSMHNPALFEVFSFGRDGLPDTADDVVYEPLEPAQ